MATPFSSYRPFDTGAGASVSEAGWRAMAKHWLTSGPIRTGNGLEVYGDSSGRQVKVKTGEVWIQGHHGQLDTLTTLSITANTSGLGRVDLVVARMDSTANLIELDVVLGTPGVSPVAPSLTMSSTVWEVPLATVVVGDGVSTITAGAVFDARNFAGPWDTTWTSLTLVNSWVPYGSPYVTPAYRRIGDVVELRGLAKDGVTTLGTTICTLPAGFRPPSGTVTVTIVSGTATGVGRIDISTSGAVTVSTGITSFACFDNVSFSTTA